MPFTISFATSQNKDQLFVSKFMNQLSKESYGSGLTRQLVLYTPETKVNNYCEIVNIQQQETGKKTAKYLAKSEPQDLFHNINF